MDDSTILRIILLLIGAAILVVIYLLDRRKKVDRDRDIFADHLENDDVLMGRDGAEPSLQDPLVQPVEELPDSREDQGRIEPSLQHEFNDQTEENIRLESEPVELTDRVEPISEAWEQESFDEVLDEPAPAAVVSTAPDSEITAENPTVTADEAAAEPAPPVEAPKPAAEEVVVMYVVAPEGAPFSGEKIFRAFRVRKLRFGDMDLFHRQERVDGQLETQFTVASMLKPGTLKPAEIRQQELKGLSMFMRVGQVRNPRAAYDDMLATAQHLAADLGGTVCDNTVQPLSQQTINHVRARLSV